MECDSVSLKGAKPPIPARQVLFDVPMREHTSFRIGGPADALVLPESVEEVQAVCAWCLEQKVPLFVMGNGSNLLVRDGGIRGVVMKVADGLSGVRREGDDIIAGAGITLRRLAAFALEESLSGLEFASGIPGTLGGALYMNAGAYEGEMKDVIFRVEAVDASGRLVTLGADDIAFGYRKSALQERDLVAVEARARLVRADKDQILAKMKDLDERRSCKQPLKMPSAGSTFKRPPGGYAGPLIQDAGLKGFRIGGAQVSCKHAGFVVNVGGATARDVMAVIDEVRRRVEERFGVTLAPEVKVVGEDAR